jgi:hypothetical protein
MRARSMPPTIVPRRDLAEVRTMRGVHLGMTRAQVEAREGPAPHVQRSAATRRIAVSYSVPLPGTSTCLEERTFVCADDHLDAIDIEEAC